MKTITQGFFAFIYLLFSIMPPLLSEGTDPTLRAVLVVNCIVQMIQIILQIAFTVDLEKKAGEVLCRFKHFNRTKFMIVPRSALIIKRQASLGTRCWFLYSSLTSQNG